MKEAAAEDCGSAIWQAFLAALQEELASLYQLMAQLDALAGHPLPAGDAGMRLQGHPTVILESGRSHGHERSRVTALQGASLTRLAQSMDDCAAG